MDIVQTLWKLLMDVVLVVTIQFSTGIISSIEFIGAIQINLSIYLSI